MWPVPRFKSIPGLNSIPLLIRSYLSAGVGRGHLSLAGARLSK